MLFGNGLSALMTLMGISTGFVILFIVGPLLLSRRELSGSGWPRWLAYFGLLGAGFMLIEVALLQRFVLLLGHPVYSLTVTLFSLLLGTGIGSVISRRFEPATLGRGTQMTILAILGVAALAIVGLPWMIKAAIAAPHGGRVALAVIALVPAGILMGVPLPAGVRLLAGRRPELVAWGWGMNGALSVIGATLAVFIAMNWGFSATLMAGSAAYLGAAVLLRATTDS
jgi:hypothetical protein